MAARSALVAPVPAAAAEPPAWRRVVVGAAAATTAVALAATAPAQVVAVAAALVSARSADTDNDSMQDIGEPSDTATKTWVLPSGTALCVVKITNGGWIVTDDADRASFGGVAKESSALEASGNEQYLDHGPAEPLNVHSI